jgi:hypothetical protein
MAIKTKAIILLTLIFFISCAAQAAPAKKADWIGKSWDDSTYYYFSGISSA